MQGRRAFGASVNALGLTNKAVFEGGDEGQEASDEQSVAAGVVLSAKKYCCSCINIHFALVSVCGRWCKKQENKLIFHVPTDTQINTHNTGLGGYTGYSDGPDFVPNAMPGVVQEPPLEEHLAQVSV